MKTTRYFEEQVLRKRPYIKREWCEKALEDPIESEVQSEGRIRFLDFHPRIRKVFASRDFGGW